MKVILKNTSLKFMTANILSKSITKTFSAGDVGSEASVVLTLDTTIKPNIPFKVTVTGDDGVVANNIWSMCLGGDVAMNYTQVLTNGTTVESTINGVISKIELQRGRVSAAGTITLNVVYADDSSYIPSEPISENNIAINAQQTSYLIDLGTDIVSPSAVLLTLTPVSGYTDGTVNVYPANASGTALSSAAAIYNTAEDDLLVVNPSTTAMRKIIVERRTGSSLNTIFDATVQLP